MESDSRSPERAEGATISRRRLCAIVVASAAFGVGLDELLHRCLERAPREAERAHQAQEKLREANRVLTDMIDNRPQLNRKLRIASLEEQMNILLEEQGACRDFLNRIPGLKEQFARTLQSLQDAIDILSKPVPQDAPADRPVA